MNHSLIKFKFPFNNCAMIFHTLSFINKVLYLKICLNLFFLLFQKPPSSNEKMAAGLGVAVGVSISAISKAIINAKKVTKK